MTIDRLLISNFTNPIPSYDFPTKRENSFREMQVKVDKILEEHSKQIEEHSKVMEGHRKVMEGDRKVKEENRKVMEKHRKVMEEYRMVMEENTEEMRDLTCQLKKTNASGDRQLKSYKLMDGDVCENSRTICTKNTERESVILVKKSIVDPPKTFFQKIMDMLENFIRFFRYQS